MFRWLALPPPSSRSRALRAGPIELEGLSARLHGPPLAVSVFARSTSRSPMRTAGRAGARSSPAGREILLRRAAVLCCGHGDAREDPSRAGCHHDSYFVVDAERTIIDFTNRLLLHAPRALARGLRGKKCYVRARARDLPRPLHCRAIAGSQAAGRSTRSRQAGPSPTASSPSSSRRCLLQETATPEGAMVVHRTSPTRRWSSRSIQDMLENEKGPGAADAHDPLAHQGPAGDQQQLLSLQPSCRRSVAADRLIRTRPALGMKRLS